MAVKIGMNQAKELLERELDGAEELLKNPPKVDELLSKLESFLKDIPVAGETLSEVPLMISMIKAYITRSYTAVSPKVIASLVGAAVYMVKKTDLIPDDMPLIGVADDIAVMLLALKISGPELKAYAEWRDGSKGAAEDVSAFDTESPAAVDAGAAEAVFQADADSVAPEAAWNAVTREAEAAASYVEESAEEHDAAVIKELIGRAAAAMAFSYSPYSHFAVGAALLCGDGSVYTGCNVENAAYGPTICAERTAFVKAVSEGHRDFEAIAILGGPDGAVKDYCPPCGVCRQVMAEFCSAETFRIITARSAEDYQIHLLREYLPDGFGPGMLR